MGEADQVVVPDVVERRILLIRGQKVILDADLARLYGVPTKRLNEQVRAVFEAIQELMSPPEPRRRPIGFRIERK